MKYKSKFEERIAGELKKRRVEFDYEKVHLEYSKPVYNGMCQDCKGEHVISQRFYTPDFYLPKQKIFIETKGKFTPENRTKMIHVKECHPELEIKMLFMRDNWITKAKKKRYSDWCEYYGFDYAVGEIPKEWLKKKRNKKK